LFRANAEDTGKKRLIPFAEGRRWYYTRRGRGRGEESGGARRVSSLGGVSPAGYEKGAANGFAAFFSFSLSLSLSPRRRG